MASCKLGHVYIIETVLSKPMKEKYAICVCVADGFFLWFNTEARPHGKDQVAAPAGCHELIKHDSFIDMSKMFRHPDFELAGAKEFARISDQLCQAIIDLIDAGPEILPPRHAALIRENLETLLK
jgi:hypothetical protein